MKSYTNFINQKSLSKIFICLTFISLFSIKNFAQSEEWYMVFETGNAPKRAAFFVDMNSAGIGTGGVARINFVNVFEETGNPQYTNSLLEFRCNNDEWRVVSGENYTFQNTSVTFKDSPWQKNSEPLFKFVKKLACNADLFSNARQKSINSVGKVDTNKLNAELKRVELDEIPILLLTSSAIPDFDSVLEVLWSKFWNAKRPTVTGTAKNTDKKQPPTAQTNQRAEELVKSGAEFVRIGDYDKALANFNEAIRLIPTYSAPYFYRGYIFAEVGEFDLAISNYTKAIEYNPSDFSSYWNRGLIYFEQKHQFERAESDFNKVVQSDPQEAKYYFYRANLYESWGKTDLEKADRKKFDSLGGSALPGFEGRRRTLFPNAQFDANLAKQGLEQGTSTVIGRACAYFEGLKFDARNAVVVLYPVTPYFESWHQLREKREDKKTAVYISREAQKYALTARANSEGRFVFSRLKPGKYFLQIIFDFQQIKRGWVSTGSSTAQVGDVMVTTNYGYNQDYYVDRSARLEKFVEIKQAGQTEKVTLKNKRTIKGCSDLW